MILDIWYGGKAATRKLKLLRLPVDQYGREWSRDPTEVERMLKFRTLFRKASTKSNNARKPEWRLVRPRVPDQRIGTTATSGSGMCLSGVINL